MQRQKTALISVYDKTDIETFAKSLVDLGWKIISSGGTAKYLKDAEIAVTDVAEITGMPPILGHRVVTLHPKIHGGLLALNIPEHLAELEKYGIPWIDLVCCDLYPLAEETKSSVATRESVIEKTDIGGPAMLCSGANGRRITVCDVADRAKVLEWLKNGEPDKEEFLNNLAAKTEMVISKYCAISGEYHSDGEYKGIFGKKILECAYGENAYQKPASLYKTVRQDLTNESVDVGCLHPDPLAIHKWQLVAGSPLSYNNLCDLDRMTQTMTHIGAGFEKNLDAVPFVAIGAKHGNACGAGLCHAEAGYDPAKAGVDPRIEAVDKMLQGDLRAIFGGCVMLNFPVDEKIADELIHKFARENRRLLDVVSAPSFSEQAIEILSRKKGKCRLLANSAILKAGLSALDTAKRFRFVRGGFLEQPNYTFIPNLSRTVLDSVILAWAIGSTSNSNTITLVKNGRLYGNGVGQQDRIGAAKLAIFRADEATQFVVAEQKKNFADGRFHPQDGGMSKNLSSAPLSADLENAVAYSDSFFPFPDAVEVLINRGIKTIFSTSGSVNDSKIMELCKAKNVNLIMLPDTEARGFYQH